MPVHGPLRGVFKAPRAVGFNRHSTSLSASAVDGRNGALPQSSWRKASRRSFFSRSVHRLGDFFRKLGEPRKNGKNRNPQIAFEEMLALIRREARPASVAEGSLRRWVDSIAGLFRGFATRWANSAPAISLGMILGGMLQDPFSFRSAHPDKDVVHELSKFPKVPVKGSIVLDEKSFPKNSQLKSRWLWADLHTENNKTKLMLTKPNIQDSSTQVPMWFFDAESNSWKEQSKHFLEEGDIVILGKLPEIQDRLHFDPVETTVLRFAHRSNGNTEWTLIELAPLRTEDVETAKPSAPSTETGTLLRENPSLLPAASASLLAALAKSGIDAVSASKLASALAKEEINVDAASGKILGEAWNEFAQNKFSGDESVAWIARLARLNDRRISQWITQFPQAYVELIGRHRTRKSKIEVEAFLQNLARNLGDYDWDVFLVLPELYDEIKNHGLDGKSAFHFLLEIARYSHLSREKLQEVAANEFGADPSEAQLLELHRRIGLRVTYLRAIETMALLAREQVEPNDRMAFIEMYAARRRHRLAEGLTEVKAFISVFRDFAPNIPSGVAELVSNRFTQKMPALRNLPEDENPE